jgi:hypothetical protein
MFSISQIRFASLAFTKLLPVTLLSIKAYMTIWFLPILQVAKNGVS